MILKLLLSLAIPLGVGYIVVSCLLRGDEGATIFERLFYGTGVGFGLLTFGIFLLSLCRIPLGIIPLTVLMALTAVPFLLVLHKGHKGGGIGKGLLSTPILVSDGKPTSNATVTVTTILFLWIGLKFIFVGYEAFTRPIFSWDTWANWSAGAKLFFYSGHLILDPGSEYFLGSTYRPFAGHPLHTSLLQSWTALFIGDFHEVYVKSWSYLYYISTGGILYFGVRRETGSVIYGIWALFFFLSMPLLTYHGSDAYADLVLAYYGLGGGVLLFRYLKGAPEVPASGGILSLMGVFTAFAIWTKNEGLFFFIAFTLPLFYYLIKGRVRKGAAVLTVGRELLTYLLPIAVIGGTWFAFKVTYSLGFGHSIGAPLGLDWLGDPKYGVERSIHWRVIGEVIGRVLWGVNFNIVIPLWLLLSIAHKVLRGGRSGYGPSGPFDLQSRSASGRGLSSLHFTVIIIISLFLFTYLTLEPSAVTEGTGINRNILTFVPIIYFVTSLIFISLWDEEYDPSGSKVVREGAGE